MSNWSYKPNKKLSVIDYIKYLASYLTFLFLFFFFELLYNLNAFYSDDIIPFYSDDIIPFYSDDIIPICLFRHYSFICRP